MFTLKKINDGKHKYQVKLDSGRIIKFGAYGYEDFTIHKDPQRKKRYIARHNKENWHNPHTKGFWARWLLWNKPTITASIANIRKRFGIKIRKV